MPRYSLCGWQLQSDVTLEGVTTGTENTEPDFTLTLGVIPPNRHDDVVISPVLTMRPDGTLLFEILQFGKALFSQHHIITEFRSHVSPGEQAAFVLGPILALLGHFTKRVPIHASCAKLNRSCIAFSGLPGAGKSSIAAGFAQRGYELLADDVCMIAVDKAGVQVLPSSSLTKLTAQSAAAFGPIVSGVRVRHKHFFPTAALVTHAPVPLKQILFLERVRASDCAELHPIAAETSVAYVHGAVLIPGAANALSRQSAMLADVAAIVSNVCVARLLVPEGLEKIHEVLDLIANQQLLRDESQ